MEPIIAIVVLGLLISWRKGLSLGAVVALVGMFAFFTAYGAELAAGQQMAALVGMVVSFTAVCTWRASASASWR